MSKKGIAVVLTLILLSWIGFLSYWYVFKVKGHSINKMEVTENKDKTSQIVAAEIDSIKIEIPRFSISDGELFSISNNESFSFSEGKADLKIPDSLTSDFAKLAEFLNQNESKNLELNGLFTDKENNSESLSVERAEKLKYYFINNYGINEDRIITNSQSSNSIITSNNITYGAVEFNIIEMTDSNMDLEIVNEESSSFDGKDEDLLETEENSEIVETDDEDIDYSDLDSDLLASVKKSMTLYYPPNNFYVNTTRKMDSYFKNLARYFKQNPNGIIELKGYSDYEGTDISLKSLGKEKANQVKQYLMNEYDINPRNLRAKGSSSQSLQYSDIDKAKNRKVKFKFIK